MTSRRLCYEWYRSPGCAEAADLVLARAAAHIIRAHRPDLLAIHFLATDKAQHYNVAPTISYLLDLRMSGLSGTVLSEALAR